MALNLIKGDQYSNKRRDEEDTTDVNDMSGYKQLCEMDSVMEEDLKTVDPMVEQLVERALKRLENEHAAINRATWTDLGDPRIDKWLSHMELRISRLEDAFEEFTENEQTMLALNAPQAQPRERPLLQTEEIKKQAKSIQLSGLPEYLQDGISISELVARLRLEEA